MDKDKLKILLAEDDLNLGMLLADYLEGEGFEVKLCKDGAMALKAFNDRAFDLCLLDVMMPQMDGYTLAGHIRQKNKEIPVVFITARSQKADKLKGYGMGADDYITKPFDEEELLWKIKAITRRRPESRPETIAIGRYVLDCNRQSLSLNGESRRMTEKESEILKYLSANRNKLVRREAILTAVWGDDDYFLGRSLDVFITKIRKYLSADPAISIENVFKAGFIFNVPE